MVIVEWDASFVFKYVAKVDIVGVCHQHMGQVSQDCHNGTAVNISVGRRVRKSNK